MEKKYSSVKAYMKRIILICLGALLSAVVINGLYLPNHLLSGGIAGIAMLCNLILSWDTALVTFLINIPIFAAGCVLMDKQFVLFSMIGMLALSASLKITEGMPVISDNMIVVIAFGGVLYGFSIAIVVLQHGSCGGNDIITRILHRYFSIPLGTSTLMINLSILGASVYFFGIDITIMTLIANFVYSTSLNYFSEKRFYVKMLIVCSESSELLRSSLSENKGIEVVPLSGQKTDNTTLIFLKAKGLYKTRTAILSIDPHAIISRFTAESIEGMTINNRQLL